MLSIDGNNWEDGGTAPNFTASGWNFCNQAVVLNPPTDVNRAAMIRCSLYNPNATISLTAVPGGVYNVYLYTWEASLNEPQVFNISLNGQIVAKNFNSGQQGTWARLGPWPVTVTNGVITLTTAGGMGNLSGLEAWTAGTIPAATPILYASISTVKSKSIVPIPTATKIPQLARTNVPQPSSTPISNFGDIQVLGNTTLTHEAGFTNGLTAVCAIQEATNHQAPIWSGVVKTTAVTPNTIYVITGYVRYTNAAQLHMNVNFVTPSGEISNPIGSLLNGTNGWSPLNFTIAVPANVNQAKLIFSNGITAESANLSGSEVCIDTFALVAQPITQVASGLNSVSTSSNFLHQPAQNTGGVALQPLSPIQPHKIGN